MNNKIKKCEVLMLFLVAALLLKTPFLPSSSRPTYLYFILNVLIIALGADAGLLSVFTKPSEEKKQHSSLSVSTKPLMVAQDQEGSSEANTDKNKVTSASTCSEKKGSARVVEKSASEKTASGDVKMVDHDKLKKCPSMPSLFFIGGGETEAEEQEVLAEDDHSKAAAAAAEEEEEEEEEVITGKVLSGPELFAKSENFIGNFYMQLKMQREESWKKIHGFYQKAY